ncbi:hypothetical protein DCO57_08485 [Labrenzia sp. 011]|nr:hypothetical protein DCO57_08485 [Labrenzia sp. 011]
MKSSPVKKLLSLCPYTQLWRTLRRMAVERRLPHSAQAGASIALLGLCCPFFWIALLSGASRAELVFHACHSAVVFFIGVLLLLVGAAKYDGADDS